MYMYIYADNCHILVDGERMEDVKNVTYLLAVFHHKYTYDDSHEITRRLGIDCKSCYLSTQ